ncbi:MAG: hypothetical protein Q8Q42_00400 [Nanoarchaeota archaeon]|nr:hypothetical protein [Nanoarchaeota archaeon]
MYIRTKSRKNKQGIKKEYAYLVTSKRRKNSKKPPKQKIIAYLGQVIQLKDIQQTTTNNKPLKSIFRDMLKELLIFNGFKQKNKNILTKGDILIDISKNRVINIKTARKICLRVNEGHITGYTLKKLFNYKPIEATKKEVGLDFAKTLVSAGLKPSKEDFLTLYSKILRFPQEMKGFTQQHATTRNNTQR